MYVYGNLGVIKKFALVNNTRKVVVRTLVESKNVYWVQVMLVSLKMAYHSLLLAQISDKYFWKPI